MSASGPRSRGARVHPLPQQGRPALLRSSAASGLVLATQNLDGITGRGTRSLSSLSAFRSRMGAVKILVVDDERAVRESLRRALELEGYEIELAADGQEALYRLQSNGDPGPDAVILDVLMPGVDGLEVCRRLRRAGNRVPVLMLTARDEVE